MLFHLITINPALYWFVLLGAFIGLARGWYCVGALGQVGVLAAPAPARSHFRVRWQSRPCMQSVLVQFADVSIMGRLESDVDYLAGSIAIKVTY